MDLKKPVKHENEEYKKYIQMQPCCSCGAPAPSMLHHCRKIDPGRPTQSKVSIYNGLPMCHACHIAEHNGMGMDILELYQSAFHLLREWVEGLYEPSYGNPPSRTPSVTPSPNKIGPSIT